jgi:hypothetical protein
VKYEVGDKIIVLHSDEEGKVTEIINDKMVMIEVRGVKFPAYMDQIDFPYFKMFSQKKIIEKKKIFIDEVKKEKPTGRKKVADGVFINLIPVYDKDIFDDEIVEKLKLYLINYNEEEYYFKYNLSFLNESHFELNSKITGLTDFYLHDILFEDLSDNPSFNFEFSLIKENKKKAPFFERSLKLRGKQIFKKIEEIQLKNEPSFSYELFDFYPDKIDEPTIDLTKLGNAGFRMYEAARIKDYLPPSRTVVDLHIEKLVDYPSDLSPAEILEIQLNEFEKYFELAVLHHLTSIIFIHGIGEGKLRNEIHERLSLKSKVKSYVNQYHHLYGYGATEVFLGK